MPIYRIEGFIKNYNWGSYSSIKDIFKEKNFNFKPEAELWIGSCKDNSSKIILKNVKKNILDIIQHNPNSVLGEKVKDDLGINLPFLLKVLAINNPLSIQVHPCVDQAIKGFFNENFVDEPYNNLLRNYNDLNRKIECICAINPTWLLVGFRKMEEIKIIIKNLFSNDFNFFINELLPNFSKKKIKFFFYEFMSLKKEKIRSLTNSVVKKIKKLRHKSLIFEWILRLYRLYPNDISIFAPIIMNTVLLYPGQAILISERVIHAYMEGIGIEIMTNSDNIIRSGITNKCVNTDNFFKVIDFQKTTKLLSLKKHGIYEYFYYTRIPEFTISLIILYSDNIYLATIDRNLEIILCTRGFATVVDVRYGKNFKIGKGEIILITSSVFRYSISGIATIFKVSIPVLNDFF